MVIRWCPDEDAPDEREIWQVTDVTEEDLETAEDVEVAWML